MIVSVQLIVSVWLIVVLLAIPRETMVRSDDGASVNRAEYLFR